MSYLNKLLTIAWFIHLVTAASLGNIRSEATSTSATKNEHLIRCDLRLWIRAADLETSTVSEGHARLVNNLTLAIAHGYIEHCKAVSWSLGIRYRERAAIKAPAKVEDLPEKPKYNFTWSQRPVIWDSADETRSSELFESPIDPHKTEREAYDKKLERYAQEMRNKDRWIVVEEEIEPMNRTAVRTGFILFALEASSVNKASHLRGTRQGWSLWKQW